jgi:tetratricopeptide (TPR) repeat protein
LAKKKRAKKVNKKSESAKNMHPGSDVESNSELALNLPNWVKSELFISILFFLLGFLLYSLSLNNEFVWDDVEVIKKSYFNFENTNLKSIFIPAVSEAKKLLYYRPTIPISYIVDWNNWKLNPFGYHLSNSIFYSISIVAMFFLSQRLAGLFSIKRVLTFSIVATLLFALHPMHVESVSWIAGRTDVLCTLFFLFALGFHILSYEKLYVIPIVCFSYLFSLFSKEVAVAFPFLVVCLDLLIKRPLNRHDIFRYFIYFGILALYLYLRSRSYVNVPGVYNPDIVSSSGGTNQFLYYLGILKVFVASYAYYLKQLFFPYTFNSFVTYLPTETLYLSVSVILVSIMVVFFFYSYRKKKNFIALNIFWIFLTLGPSVLIAIFAFIATPVSERYLFLPSAGYCMLIGYLLAGLIDKPSSKKLSLAVTILLVGSYLFFTIDRQGVWKNRLNFWEDASSKSDHHAIPHINYGMALLDAGRTEEAISEFNISLRSDITNTPTGRAIAANNLGVAYINKKNYVGAAKSLLIALESDPTFYKTYYHFGLLYYIKAGTSKLKEDYLYSERYLVQATKIYPRYGKAYLLLARLNSNFGNKDKAVHYAQKALQSGLIDQLAMQARKIIQMYN